MSAERDERWDAIPVGRAAIYDSRAKDVYWNRNFPACRAKGNGKAECLLNPDHRGPHYGNGYDNYGPTSAISWENKDSRRELDITHIEAASAFEYLDDNPLAGALSQHPEETN